MRTNNARRVLAGVLAVLTLAAYVPSSPWAINASALEDLNEAKQSDSNGALSFNISDSSYDHGINLIRRISDDEATTDEYLHTTYEDLGFWFFLDVQDEYRDYNDIGNYVNAGDTKLFDIEMGKVYNVNGVDIRITAKLLDDNRLEVTYELENKTESDKYVKYGSYADTWVENDSQPTDADETAAATNDNGLKWQNESGKFIVETNDTEDFKNWIGSYYNIIDYSPTAQFRSGYDDTYGNSMTSWHWDKKIGEGEVLTTKAVLTLTDKCIIRFDSKGGSDVDTMFVEAGSNITLPTPERENYMFLGWYTDSALTNKFTGSSVNDDTTLYARWTKVKHYDKKDPTCTRDGNIEYWHVPELNAYYEDEALTKKINKSKTIKDALGHDTAAPGYTWSADNKNCTGTLFCMRENKIILKEKATVTATVKEAPTKDKMGTTLYTATFQDKNFRTQQFTLVDIPAIGYGDEFTAYQQQLIGDLDDYADADDTALTAALIDDGKNSLSEKQYDKNKSIDENYALLDNVYDKAVSGIDEQRETEFDEYKNSCSNKASSLAQNGDSKKCINIIKNAKKGISGAQYSPDDSIADNRKKVDDILASASASLDEARRNEYTDYAKGKSDELKALADDDVCGPAKTAYEDGAEKISSREYDGEQTRSENEADVIDMFDDASAKADDEHKSEFNKFRDETAGELNELADKADTDETKAMLKKAAENIGKAEYDSSTRYVDNITKISDMFDDALGDMNELFEDLFETKREQYIREADDLTTDEQSEACKKLIQTAKDSVRDMDMAKEGGYLKGTTKMLEIVSELKHDLNAQYKEDFAAEKQAAAKAADELVSGDEDETCKKLAEDLKKAIEDLTYDDSKTYAENKAAVAKLLEDFKAAYAALHEDIDKYLGDVNGDGRINVTDLSKTAAHVKSVKALTDEEFGRADLDKNGKMNVTDLSKLAGYLKGISSFK